MKWKLATIMGILLYVLVYVFTSITNGILTIDFPIFKTYMPIWVVFFSILFGVAYIRNLKDNELAEGLVFGVYLFIISIILEIIKDLILNVSINSFLLHYSYIYLFYPIITTALGYMASFEVQL